jgi:hypothetical protein
MSSTVKLHRPYGRIDSQGYLDNNLFTDEAFRGQYSGDNLIYKGFARPGATEGSLVWQIAFLTYDASGNVLTITWPQKLINGLSVGPASNDYEFSWTDRTSYTYS